MSTGTTDGTSAELTVESATPGFLSLLSAEAEDPQARETPPAESHQPAPESAEEATQPADAEEGQSEQSEESDSETETPPDPPATVKVKVDGQEQEVTLDEALKGYSRTQDYTRKTQAIAEERKALEAEKAAVRDERQKYAASLKPLEEALTGSVKEPDWDAVKRDRPAEYPQLYADFQRYKDQIATVRSEREATEQKMRADFQVELQARLKDEQGKLLEAIPQWKDPAVAKTQKAELVAYATKQGFTPEEIQNVVDHRPLVLLHKAMQYDKAQAAKPALQQKIDKVKSATPGPGKVGKGAVSEETKALQRLAKDGSTESAAGAFLTMLQAKRL